MVPRPGCQLLQWVLCERAESARICERRTEILENFHHRPHSSELGSVDGFKMVSTTRIVLITAGTVLAVGAGT